MKLYLHIGTEKTGTTLLQNFLYRNATHLSNQRIYLSRVLSRPNNRSLVHFFSSRKDDFWLRNGIRNQEEKDNYYFGFIDRLTEEVESVSSTHDSMIISSEHFHSRLTDESEVVNFARYINKTFTDVRVICYFREQSAVRKSLYSTALKGRSADRLSEFMATDGPSSSYFNYYDLACRWANAFGRSALRFRIYDREQFVGNDLRRDFFSIIEEPVDLSTFDFEVSSANQSLSYLQAAAYRSINENCSRFLDGGGINPLNLTMKRAASQSRRINLGEIFEPNQVEFFQRFLESNEMFFREFMQEAQGFSTPVVKEVSYDNKEFSINDLYEIVEDIFSEVTTSMNHAMVRDSDADFLKNVALKYDGNETLSLEDAVGLMELAARARPSGTIIQKKLKEWKNGR